MEQADARGEEMTKTELLALAGWHQAMADEPKRAASKKKKHAATAALLRTLATADEKMPVVGYADRVEVENMQIGAEPSMSLAPVSEFDVPLVRATDAQAAVLAAYEAGRAENQALIDRLMLEYCPDEMTPEQKANWAKHQRAGKGFDHLLGQEPHHD
jgi:hypothetical protein